MATLSSYNKQLLSDRTAEPKLFIGVLGFKNEVDLFHKYAKVGNGTTVAIIFNSKEGSPNFDYTIRIYDQFFSWKTGELYRNSFTFQPGQGK